MSQSPKDLVIKRLKSQLEIYKTKVEESSFDNLSQKVTELEGQIAQKDQLISDLKKTAQMDGGSGDDGQKIKTKMIVLQSKNRKQQKEINELKSEIDELKSQNSRLKKTSGGSQDTTILKRQLDQEIETTNRLRAQINSLSSQQGSLDSFKKRIRELEERLSRSGTLNGGSGGEMGQYQEQVRLLQEENESLKNQIETMASGGGGNPMSALRLQREVEQLKSKIIMLKKDNEQMQKKYQDVMRKQEFSLDDGW